MERLLRDIYDAISSLRQRISYLETQDGVADLSDAMSFVQLTDTPDNYIGQAGKIVAVTAGEDGLEFVAGGGALADHDHSGDPGDGGTFDAANLTSGAAADGYVLTADGSGGAAWEAVSGGASELDDLTDVDLTTPPSDGQALVFDSGSSTWKAETLAGGVTDFLDLSDTPASYTYPLAPLRVNNSGDGVEDVPGIRLNAFSSASASILIESELSRFTAITKSNSVSPALTLYRYRGSVESALAVEDGDVLGGIGFYGSPNGTNVVNGAEIRATVDGTVTTSPNRVPAKLAFRVFPAGGLSAVERITLRSSGRVGIDQTEPEDKLHVSGAVALDDITTPSTPSSDTHKIYAKSDGLYVLNSAGTEVGPLGSGGGATELDDLTDVDLTTPPTDGQVLTYDDGSETWRAGTIAAGAALTVKEADGTPEVANVGTIVVTNGTLTDDGGGQITLDLGSAATDGSAIHDNVSGEIAALTEKTTPVSADLLIIEDSEDSNAKKKVQIGNLPGSTDLRDIKRLVALGM